MEKLKSLFHEVANDAVDMAQYTLTNCPDITKIEECFPYEAFRMITINGKDYRVKIEIQMSEMKW